MTDIENNPSRLAEILKNLFDSKPEEFPRFKLIPPEMTEEQRERLKKSWETLIKNINEGR